MRTKWWLSAQQEGRQATEAPYIALCIVHRALRDNACLRVVNMMFADVFAFDMSEVHQIKYCQYPEIHLGNECQCNPHSLANLLVFTNIQIQP